MLTINARLLTQFRVLAARAGRIVFLCLRSGADCRSRDARLERIMAFQQKTHICVRGCLRRPKSLLRREKALAHRIAARNFAIKHAGAFVCKSVMPVIAIFIN